MRAHLEIFPAQYNTSPSQRCFSPYHQKKNDQKPQKQSQEERRSFQYTNAKLVLEWEGVTHNNLFSGSGLFSAYETIGTNPNTKKVLLFRIQAENWKNGRPQGKVKVTHNIFHQKSSTRLHKVKECRYFTGFMKEFQFQGQGSYKIEVFTNNFKKRTKNIEGIWKQGRIAEALLLEKNKDARKMKFMSNIQIIRKKKQNIPPTQQHRMKTSIILEGIKIKEDKKDDKKYDKKDDKIDDKTGETQVQEKKDEKNDDKVEQKEEDQLSSNDEFQFLESSEEEEQEKESLKIEDGEYMKQSQQKSDNFSQFLEQKKQKHGNKIVPRKSSLFKIGKIIPFTQPTSDDNNPSEI